MIEFTTTFNTRKQPQPKNPDDSLKYTILLVGPFAGDAPTPFTDPVVADVDSFATIMERTAPAASVGTEQLVFKRPTDFDPLLVAQSHGSTSRWISWLSAVRTGGPDCQAAREAVAALKVGSTPAMGESPEAQAPEGDEASSGSTFEDLLSGSATVSSEPVRRPASSIVDKLISETVSGIPSPSHEKTDALLNTIAEKLGGQLRQIYHDRAFRSLETVWMALDELITDFDTDDPVRFLFLPFSQTDWNAFLEDTEEAARLRVRLAEVCDFQPDVIVTTEVASPLPEKEGILKGLASLSESFGCPVIANADFRDLLKQVPSGPITKADLLDESPYPAFIKPRVRLATPRFRIRLPYGEEWNPAGSFGFEEFLPSDSAECLPWGPASLLCVRAWASKYREEEEDINWNEATQMAGFPPITKGATVVPATEYILTENAMAHLYRLGCLPVTAMRNSDRILIGG